MPETKLTVSDELKQTVKDNAYDSEALSKALKQFKLEELRELGKEFCGLRVNTATKTKTIGQIVEFIELYRGLSPRERDLYLMRGRDLRLVCKRLKIPQDMFDGFENRAPVAEEIIRVETEKNCTAPLPRSQDGFIEKYWRIRGFLAESLGETDFACPTDGNANQTAENTNEISDVTETQERTVQADAAADVVEQTNQSIATPEPTVMPEPTAVVSIDPPMEITLDGADEQLSVSSDGEEDEITRIREAVKRGEPISFSDLQTYSNYLNSVKDDEPAKSDQEDTTPAQQITDEDANVSSDEDGIADLTPQAEANNETTLVEQPQHTSEQSAEEKLMQRIEVAEQERSAGESIDITPEQPAVFAEENAQVPGNEPDLPSSVEQRPTTTAVDGDETIADMPAFNELTKVINAFDNDIDIELSIQEDLVTSNDEPVDNIATQSADSEEMTTPSVAETARKIAEDVDARLREAEQNLERRVDYIKRSFAADIDGLGNTEIRLGDAFDEQIKRAKHAGRIMLDTIEEELEARLSACRHAASSKSEAQSKNDATPPSEVNEMDVEPSATDMPAEPMTSEEIVTVADDIDEAVDTTDAENISGAVSAEFVPVLSDSESPIHARIAFAKARVESELARRAHMPLNNETSATADAEARDDEAVLEEQGNENSADTNEQQEAVEEHQYGIFDFDANNLAEELIAESEALASIPDQYEQKLREEAAAEADADAPEQQDVSFWEHLIHEEEASEVNGVAISDETDESSLETTDVAIITDDNDSVAFVKQNVNDVSATNSNDSDAIIETSAPITTPLDELSKFGEIIIDDDMDIDESPFISSAPRGDVFNFDDDIPLDELIEEPIDFVENVSDDKYEGNITDSSNINVTLPNDGNEETETGKTSGWISGTRNTGARSDKPRRKSLRINRQDADNVAFLEEQTIAFPPIQQPINLFDEQTMLDADSNWYVSEYDQTVVEKRRGFFGRHKK